MPVSELVFALMISLVCFSTSVDYSRTSSYKGTRLMVLCDVALGKCFDTCHHDVTLTRPPDDFDSVHGVRCSDDVTSDFKVSGNKMKMFLVWWLGRRYVCMLHCGQCCDQGTRCRELDKDRGSIPRRDRGQGT